MGDLVQREHPQIRVEYRVGSKAHKSCEISETVQDRTNITIADYALSIGTKFIDLG